MKAAKNKKPSKRRENRIAAIQYLYAWESNRPDHLISSVDLFFEGKDQPREYYQFGEELLLGTLDKVEEVDGKIRALAQNWDFHRIAKIDLAILRLAIYEILYRQDIPPIVSINEAIDLSKEFSNPEAKRFINGILDKFKGEIKRPLRQAGEKFGI
ncbi:MAG: transcription antitermination factor NusB [Opitutales bacterium]|nr:transcription antitermination factor NusB [Opitutales bacterium]